MALEKLVYRVKVAADQAGAQAGSDGRTELCPVLAALLNGGTEGANRGQLPKEGGGGVSGVSHAKSAAAGGREPREGSAHPPREAGAAVREGGAGAGRSQFGRLVHFSA